MSLTDQGVAIAEHERAQPPPRARLSSAALAALPVAIFAVVAVAYTLDVWRDPAHVSAGGLGDNLHWINFLAWTPHALSHLQNPLYTEALDYPHGVNLAWNTSAPLAGVLMWPVTATAGPVVAYNGFVLLAVTLDGWCTYLWLHRHTRSAVAALLGALVVILGPWIPTHIVHLNLLGFWFLPLMFIAAEKIIATAGSSRTRWAVLFALAAAGQFYVSAEVLALGFIAIAVALLIALLLSDREARRRAPAILAHLGLAAVVFIALAGPFVLYQLFGPYPIHGSVQPANTFVADLENFVIPSAVTWLWPQSATRTVAQSWTGFGEATAFIGVPLLLACMYAAIRGRRNRRTRVVCLTAVATAVLSLGPHLHAGGVDTNVPLPAILLYHVPLIDNILPVRFSLMTAFGMAYLLATVLDQTLLAASLRRRLGSGVGLVALASIASVMPLATSPLVIPQFFTPSGAVSTLPPSTVALVGPYIGEGATAIPMMWQAVADFRFALIDGYAVTANDQGGASFVLDNPIRRAFSTIQAYGSVPQETPQLRESLRAALHARGVTMVLIGPMPHRDAAVGFVAWLVGSAPQEVQGVEAWNHVPAR